MITLSENFRALFYTPFYAAHATGAYEAEKVDVRLRNSPIPPAPRPICAPGAST